MAPRRAGSGKCGGRWALAGRLVSGDARSCQRALCRQVPQAQGDYWFAVTGTQPDWLADRTLLFTAPLHRPASPPRPLASAA